MYIVTTPWLLRQLFPSFLTWSFPNKRKEVYLTFDDGPHPVATPFVLDLLKQYNARATFFCIGKNVQEHPALYRRILDEGHRVGNHTFDHLNGKKSTDKDYLENILKAKKIMDTDLFRPPYGAITRFQANQLKAFYRIIMWNVLSADFDTTITKEKCLKNVMKHTRQGSIIVFHDSEKAFKNLEYALPKTLDFLKEKGYLMKAVS